MKHEVQHYFSLLLSSIDIHFYISIIDTTYCNGFHINNADRFATESHRLRYNVLFFGTKANTRRRRNNIENFIESLSTLTLH